LHLSNEGSSAEAYQACNLNLQLESPQRLHLEAWTCTRMHALIQHIVCTHVCVLTHMHACKHACTHTCTHTHLHIHLFILLHGPRVVVLLSWLRMAAMTWSHLQPAPAYLGGACVCLMSDVSTV